MKRKPYTSAAADELDQYSIEPGDVETVEVYSVVHTKQRDFMENGAKYRLFGGAAGGGKSHAMRMECVKQCLAAPGVRGLVLRRTFPEIEENMINPLLQELPPWLYEYNAAKHVITFYNGSTIRFGYCRNKKDIAQYHGLQYDFLCIEELTHWLEDEFKIIRRVLRSSRAGVIPNFFASANPGNIGHAWVKRIWIDRKFTPTEDPAQFAFIPSRVWDNPSILEADPDYLKILEDMPEKQRKALLFGDWNVYEGQFFAEWNDDVHVCDPVLPIAGVKRRIVAADYGSSSPSAIYWMALMNDGRIIVYREVYGPFTYEKFAQAILDNTTEAEFKDLRTIVVDPAIIAKKTEESGSTGGEIIGRVFRAAKRELTIVGGKNARIDGWNAMHKWLEPVPDANDVGLLMSAMVIARNCENAIRTIPALVHDARDVEDLDTRSEDHPADGIRYGVMFFNVPPPRSLIEVQSLNDALLRTQQRRESDRRARPIDMDAPSNILTTEF